MFHLKKKLLTHNIHNIIIHSIHPYNIKFYNKDNFNKFKIELIQEMGEIQRIENCIKHTSKNILLIRKI